MGMVKPAFLGIDNRIGNWCNYWENIITYKRHKTDITITTYPTFD